MYLYQLNNTLCTFISSISCSLSFLSFSVFCTFLNSFYSSRFSSDTTFFSRAFLLSYYFYFSLSWSLILIICSLKISNYFKEWKNVSIGELKICTWKYWVSALDLVIYNFSEVWIWISCALLFKAGLRKWVT